MKIAIIGGGPAGMLSAAVAARNGHRVTLLEHNEKLGKKLYITGKGRCNVTNAGGREAFFENVVRNPRFLYSAWGALNAEELCAMIEALGVPLKAERGGRVFPETDKSSDVLRALERHLNALGVDVRLRTKALGIHIVDGMAAGVRLENGILPSDAVILATGGASYPATGSTGDGYRFLKECGHTIIEPKPSLIPLETVEEWPRTLSGLTLKNVTLRAYNGQKLVYEELGEMLFAHFGVTGPLVLSASAYLGDAAPGARLTIDLKPGLTEEQLDKRLLRDIEAAQQKNAGNALSGLLPQRLLPIVFAQSGIVEQMRASELTRAQRKALVQSLKALPLTIKRTRPISEAIITRGGVSTKEVHPSTLESKLLPGLYIAGELLDVDALTGGYNLQIAWSTGALAGMLKGMQQETEE